MSGGVAPQIEAKETKETKPEEAVVPAAEENKSNVPMNPLKAAAMAR